MEKLNQDSSDAAKYTSVSQGIRVSVEPIFVEERSDRAARVYVFSYQINIENHGEVTVKLLNRHWKVFSGSTQFSDVKGEGVVGEQPILDPGHSFAYTSWAIIEDPLGHMEGTFTFRSSLGNFFDVAVPRFELIYVDEASIN